MSKLIGIIVLGVATWLGLIAILGFAAGIAVSFFELAYRMVVS